MKYVALVLAFCINFILLFYKVRLRNMYICTILSFIDRQAAGLLHQYVKSKPKLTNNPASQKSTILNSR